MRVARARTSGDDTLNLARCASSAHAVFGGRLRQRMSPIHASKITPDLRSQILKVRRDNPGWGKVRLAAALSAHRVWVSASTVGRVLGQARERGELPDKLQSNGAAPLGRPKLTSRRRRLSSSVRKKRPGGRSRITWRVRHRNEFEANVARRHWWAMVAALTDRADEERWLDRLPLAIRYGRDGLSALFDPGQAVARRFIDKPSARALQSLVDEQVEHFGFHRGLRHAVVEALWRNLACQRLARWRDIHPGRFPPERWQRILNEARAGRLHELPGRDAPIASGLGVHFQRAPRELEGQAGDCLDFRSRRRSESAGWVTEPARYHRQIRANKRFEDYLLLDPIRRGGLRRYTSDEIKRFWQVEFGGLRERASQQRSGSQKM